MLRRILTAALAVTLVAAVPAALAIAWADRSVVEVASIPGAAFAGGFVAAAVSSYRARRRARRELERAAAREWLRYHAEEA